MANSPWFNWTFWKPTKEKEDTREQQIQKLRDEVWKEHTTLENQYKLMSVRAIMVTHGNGEFSPNIPVPEAILWDMRRRMSRVGLLIESPWYDSKWTFDCTVDHINIDYNEMEELYIVDAIETFRRALDHARINGHMEVVIHGSPILINVLLPFVDVLEVYINRLPPVDAIDKGRFAKLVHASADVSSTFSIGNANLAVTKKFVTPTYKYYNIVNLTPMEIKNND